MARNILGGDVVIVGAGLIGLAIALELAQRGATVRLYDRAEPGRAASWAGAGMLAPFTENLEDAALETLCTQSLSEYPAFVERVKALGGIDPRLHLDGILQGAFSEEALHLFALRCQALRERGVPCELLDRRQVLAAEPWLGAGVRGALLIPGEGHVDNRRLGRALINGCLATGVTIARVRALRVECDTHRALGVRSSEGFVPAPTVINACGAWSGSLKGISPLNLPPIEPIKGQMLSLRAPLGFVHRTTWIPGAYLVPRDDGTLLIGATVERCGFDTRVTAAGLRELFDAALTACPALGAFSLSESWAGLRPSSPDGRPFLGQSALMGLFVAAGHYRNGILLTPATARIIADAVECGTSAQQGPFSATRLGFVEPPEPALR